MRLEELEAGAAADRISLGGAFASMIGLLPDNVRCGQVIHVLPDQWKRASADERIGGEQERWEDHALLRIGSFNGEEQPFQETH